LPVDENHPYPRISDAIDDGDCARIAELFRSNPDMRDFCVPGFGTWLHYAARFGTLKVIEYLVIEGFDINLQGLDGETPIVLSARGGTSDVTRFFLEQGAVLDTSSSLVNPLFSAVIGGSQELTRLLLDHGIDASVRYQDDWEDMDALAFASMQGKAEIADIIAEHFAKGNEQMKRTLLERAKAVAEANLLPAPPRGVCPDLTEDD
jgi:ankyrin repeat protein